MTVYFAGGEDLDFTLTNAAANNGNLNQWINSTHARGYIGITVGSTSDPPSARATTPLWGPASSFWVHGQFGWGTSTSFGNNCYALRLLDASGVARLVVQAGTSNNFVIKSRNAAGTFTTLATGAANTVTNANAYGGSTGIVVNAIDVFVNYSTSGQVTVYYNGVNVCDTGSGVNVTTDSATALAQLDLCSFNNPGFVTYVGAWSEVIVQSSSTLGAALLTLPPVAAGNTQSWTPNTVGNVNEFNANDANFVGTTTNNALSEWTVSTTLPTGSWAIGAVVQSARVSIGATGPQHFAWDVRTSAGTSSQTGTIAPAVGSFSAFRNIWPTNPTTGNPWNAGELINAGIESLA